MQSCEVTETTTLLNTLEDNFFIIKETSEHHMHNETQS